MTTITKSHTKERRQIKIGKNTKKFVKRALKETCEVNFPELLLFTFKELRKEYPVEWRYYIFSAIYIVEQELDSSQEQNVS